jgi:hypothetical protein
MALALDHVGPIHAGGVHTEQDAPGAGRRGFRLAEFQHFGPAEAVENDCFHGACVA